MKRRATAILLGIMVSSMFLSACGKNEAKEAANESAQVEEEGVGEVTEEGEKVEAENKNASDADDSSKAGDSAKSDEDNKETSVKEEEDGDSSGKDSDDESEEDAEVTEASAGKIGVLLSDDDEDAKIDSEEMTSQIEDGGYEADVKNAGGDPALQISQIQEFIDEQVSALIIDPVDSYGLTDILKTAKEQEIPVISYDRLLMNSDAVTYYATFDNYKVGQKQGEYLVDALDLDNQDGPFNIELFTGDPGDNNCNFFFGGAMDVLQKYIDEGKLVVKSGQTEFEQVATANWDSAKAQDRMDTIIAGNYSDGTNLDAVLCSNDSTALGVENALAASYTGEYPIITGQDCDTPTLKTL